MHHNGPARRVFVAQFTAEWNRLQAEVGADLDAWQAELGRVTAQIERLVDAIANGTPPAAVNGRIADLEKRRTELETLIAGTDAPAPRLHPNLAEVYRQTVSSLIVSESRSPPFSASLWAPTLLPLFELSGAGMNECSYEARKSAPKERVEVTMRPERRRRWSSEEKLRIVRETLRPGAVARLLPIGMALGPGCSTRGASRC